VSVREGTTEPSPGSLERLKLVTDSLKHMTTLNAGSIVVIGTFLADIFPNKDGTLAVGLGLKLTIAAAFSFLGCR
jgi:hypothetical protein